MSSTLPDDSVSPGSVLPDTDASSGEEYLPLYHDAENDNDNRKLVSTKAPSMEESLLRSTASEADSIPAEPDRAVDALQDSEEEETRKLTEVSQRSLPEEQTLLVHAVQIDEDEAKKPVISTDADDSAEKIEERVAADALQDGAEEETEKLTGADDVQAVGTEGAEEETKQLAVSEESTVAKTAEEPKNAPSIEPLQPPVYQLDIPRKRRFTRYWVLSVALLLLLLAAILTPLVVVASYGVNAYATYNLLRAHAYGGVQHLLTVKTIFSGASVHPTSILDQSKLTRARQEIVAAHNDFVQVRLLLDNTPLIRTVTQYLPQYRSQVASVRSASQVGIDATLIGEEVMSTALILAPRFQSPLLSTNSHNPLVTASDLQLIGSTIDAIMPYLNDIQAQSHTLALQDLPISSNQRTQLQAGFQLLPQVQTLLQRGRELLGPANWLLGVDQPRVFLVQTMDRAELRPTGGFTGQYGELSITSGRVGPFSLHDISGVEYADNSPTVGQLAPTAYRSWWPFENWGLRDSNLSADFPTTARIAIAEYKHEVKRNVDGVITFTPFFIEHILQAIGPIKIPKYNETITAENLEQKLHYYQLDNAGIRKIEIIEHVTANNPNIRKLFTSQVASVLMGRLRHATPSELLSLGLQVLHDLKTKDLQIYMTNPQIESLLEEYNDAAVIDRSNTHDGLLIVQTNVSASKASQYVQTNVHDTVKLDAQGGATHTLQMQLIYNQLGPVYGLDTYRDYVRFYVPEAARLLSGDGFDTGVALCGGPLAACPPNGVYPHQELVCPTGEYDAGAAAQMIDDPYMGAWHPIDQIGPPDNTKSDEPGKAMFGGYVVIPKNCSMTVTLSWYVPSLGHDSYDLLFQRQASTFPALDLTVISPIGTCVDSGDTGLHYNGIITQDTAFQLKSTAISRSNSTKCSLVESTNMHIVP
jgi:Protein of unknown function (DUF4012)